MECMSIADRSVYSISYRGVNTDYVLILLYIDITHVQGIRHTFITD